MKVSLRQIYGPWDAGWVLDKHTISSTHTGHNAYGHSTYETIRTPAGEAAFQLKYRNDFDQIEPLAAAVAENILPLLTQIGFIVPMPATAKRQKQPVTELASALGAAANIPVFLDVLRKAPNGKSLKDLNTKDEKLQAIGDSLSINDEIGSAGSWNVLVVDDLFHTGASMEAACKTLRTYPKVRQIYVAALTWR